MRTKTIVCLAVIAVLGCSASVTMAQTAAILAVTGPSSSHYDTNNGWSFTLSEAVNVTDLGVYAIADGGTSLGNDTPVGIWRMSDDTLMATATVDAATSAVSGFAWVELAESVTLAADTDYVIGCQAWNDGVGYKVYATLTMASEVTYTGGYATAGGGSLVMPADQIPSQYEQCCVGPNFKFAAVPEPMTMSLLALGSLGLLRRRRA